MGRKANAEAKSTQYKSTQYVVYVRKSAWEALGSEKRRIEQEMGISLTNTQALTLILLRLEKSRREASV